MKAAVEAREGGLRILAVTVLTSYDDADLAAAGYDCTCRSWSPSAPRRRATSASTALVCSARGGGEAALPSSARSSRW